MARYLIGNIKGPKGDQGPAGPAGPTYTAGEGISIENNVISATGSGGIATETDPVFSASPAATITSADITDWNAKSEFSGSYNDLTNKPDLSQYATQTQLGTGLARKQDTLTAGTNISIDNNVISATDTTYTAGTGIDITNGVISATGGSAAGIYELTDLNTTGKDDLLAMFANDNPPEVILYQNKYYKIANRLLNFSNSDVFNYTSKYDKNPIMGPEFLQFRCSLDYTSFTAIAIQNADELNGNLVTVQSAPADKFPNASSKNLAQLFTSIGNNYATKTYVDDAVAGAGGGTTYTAGTGIDITNDVISNNRYSIFPVSREANGWYSFASTKDAFIAKLNNGELVKAQTALDRVSITPAEITTGRTKIIYVGASYSSNKVSVQEVNTIQLLETKFYYLAKGRVMDTLYRFDGPDSIWKTLPIELTYESGTYKSTLVSLLNSKQNALPVITNNQSKVLAVNSNATGLEWVEQSAGGSSLPAAPAADGTYFLTTSVSSGTATQSWVTIPTANGNNF